MVRPTFFISVLLCLGKEVHIVYNCHQFELEHHGAGIEVGSELT